MKKLETINLPVKYRPRLFSDFIGQDQAVSQLLGMLRLGRMPSTLLFMGSPGMGKTTLARILARYINCASPDPKTFEPCGECPSCQMGTDHPDIVEINAADNRGIDEVRALLQQSQNMPVLGNKKVYILDECQMYTAQAQACMLKELENPAPNTVWLLASMNPEKLPAATLRRCHKITLQPVKREDMIERIAKIARREKLDLKKIAGGEKVLSAIADVSCGSMSTAISALESVVYLQGSTFDYRKAISTVFSGAEADQDEAAARVLYATLTRNDDLFMQTVIPIPSGHRSLLLKVRWLIDHLMLSAIGAAKFTPTAARKFAELSKKMKGELSSGELFRVLGVLNDAEQRMNLNLDERATFVSMLGRYIVENK